MNNCVNQRKAVIIGCGFVGSSSAFALMQSGLFSEIVLIDVDQKRAEGEAMDISHGVPFVHPMNIYAGDYKDITDAALIVVTAGAAQKPGETRLDLIKKNIAIFGSIMPQVKEAKPNGVMVIVANPVDILTLAASRMSGMPRNKVFGSGTVLDTARLKSMIGTRLDVDSRSVHAYIVGEHGDSEIVVWSSANVSGVPLDDFAALRGIDNMEEIKEEISADVRNSAYEIIARKKATYYGIAMSVARIAQAIVRDENCVLPVSTLLEGDYGIDGVALSIPAIVGQNGIVSRVPISMNEEERDKLEESSRILKKTMEGIL
ncbi:MAG: L-lactate dehydrogenase [Erysipelotrichales bacterium]|nr:L-lactate dehydrogenase [Erysipelotrichales bacterium]